jgi:hypothetical protein
MKIKIKDTQTTVVSRLHTITKRLTSILAIGAILISTSCSDTEQADGELQVDPTLGQAVFATPEDAANAFTEGLINNDSDMFEKILGANYIEVLSLEDVDEEDVKSYLSAWDQRNTLLPQGENKMLVAVGNDEWPLPIPIAQGTSGWYFDVEEGRDRIRIRTIGRNELDAMQSVLAYYDAQMEYAEQDRNGNGLLEYAQQFISTDGAQDGLFWEAEASDQLSPLGPLLADRSEGGGYHGYFYRILNAQGTSARGGAYSYLIGNSMRSGFALIAWPEEYGESGVMSFIVSHAGIVYEQNLGPDGAETANAMTAFDPGDNWIPAEEVNSPQ